MATSLTYAELQRRTEEFVREVLPDHDEGTVKFVIEAIVDEFDYLIDWDDKEDAE